MIRCIFGRTKKMDRRNQDCYFYYYSTCTKGEHCGFRHEPSALGCETMCPYWHQGKCPNQRCSLRHMELKKNRKSIPCYWENQPSGCRKLHCPFMHKKDKKECDPQVSSSQPAPQPQAQPPMDSRDWPRGGYEHGVGPTNPPPEGGAYPTPHSGVPDGLVVDLGGMTLY